MINAIDWRIKWAESLRRFRSKAIFAIARCDEFACELVLPLIIAAIVFFILNETFGLILGLTSIACWIMVKLFDFTIWLLQLRNALAFNQIIKKQNKRDRLQVKLAQISKVNNQESDQHSK